MPGKVNPVIPEVVTQVAAQVIGNDAAIAIGGMQGHFELNVFIPLMARNLLDSIRLLASASRLLAEKCVDGIEANREQCEQLRRADALGGDGAQPVHRLRQGEPRSSRRRRSRAARCARSRARQGVEESVLDEALDYRAMAKPHDGLRRLSGRSGFSKAAAQYAEGAAAGRGGMALLVRAVARADERAREDRAEAERLALLAEPAELVRVHPAVDRRMLRARLEVLADRDDVDAVRRAGRASSRRPRRSSRRGRR